MRGSSPIPRSARTACPMAPCGRHRSIVITNPSAAFNPEGTAGIINLITKKTARPGVSGSARANAGSEGRRRVERVFARMHDLRCEANAFEDDCLFGDRVEQCELLGAREVRPRLESRGSPDDRL